MDLDVVGTVAAVKRHQNTASGNPVWSLTLSDGRQFRTEPDAQCAASVSEYDVGRAVDLTVRNGRIVGYLKGEIA